MNGQSNKDWLKSNIEANKMSDDSVYSLVTEVAVIVFITEIWKWLETHLFGFSQWNMEFLPLDLVLLNGVRIAISDFHNQSIKEFDENSHLLACCSA